MAFRRTEIGSSPSNPDIVYFITDSQDGHRLRRYNAATETLVELNSVPNGSNDIEEFDSQNSYDLFVRVHPTNEDLVFLGGTNLYRSTNGFTSPGGTAWIGGYDPDAEGVRIYPGHHPDQHSAVFLPSDPDVMITGTDGGLYRTENNRQNNQLFRFKSSKKPLGFGHWNIVQLFFKNIHASLFER